MDRSNYRHPNGYHLLAAANDFYSLNIYKYPCVFKNSEKVEEYGHSSFVTNVKWSKDDNYIFSIGGEDNCVL